MDNPENIRIIEGSDNIKIDMPQPQAQKYFILMAIAVIAVILMAGVLGAYIAKYQTAKYYVEYIQQNCGGISNQLWQLNATFPGVPG